MAKLMGQYGYNLVTVLTMLLQQRFAKNDLVVAETCVTMEVIVVGLLNQDLLTIEAYLAGEALDSTFQTDMLLRQWVCRRHQRVYHFRIEPYNHHLDQSCRQKECQDKIVFSPLHYFDDQSEDKKRHQDKREQVRELRVKEAHWGCC